ncbi:MAG: preprotein translocase subunit SecY [Bacilli bacterium]|jgi:preprotein translocase subunit SecY|nr:preprotein translocase subunit SecY [Bacilli bacterium]MCH4210896.1 preprotein translocase subunit SecY [Bacilli bacterium]MCH4228125.1 preprotein translocase subunit SecY [Bacilli bacterium]MCI2054569.1 preprotein translocase subunit SecY [Bacilli bacterium]
MKKFVSIFKNKELVNRIFFTIMVLFVIRIGAVITVPGVKVDSTKMSELTSSGSSLAIMDLLGGGALSSFSIFALGVSPYITAQIIIQLLSKDVLPALSDLSKQGEYGRKKIEMATRYLTLLLGAVQAYGVIRTMQNSNYISLTLEENFWTYAYIVTILLAGAMLTMWLGDQITEKGLGNGISVIIFAGCVRSLPTQITNAWGKWITSNVTRSSSEMIKGSFQFALYILAMVFITGFVVFTELSKRKIPVQHAGKGGQSASMARASFLPIKINSAGVIPVIFAASIMSAPSIIASFISSDAANAEWLKIFNYNDTFSMPWFDGTHWNMNWGLFIYLGLIIAFTFFYAEMEIDPETLADNFQKNGSYIPGIRPGRETEKYVGKVLNRVTFIGAMALGFIAGLPVVLVWADVFDGDSSLAIGGTGLIIVVGVALELNAQIDGLLAGRSFDEVREGI